MVRKCQFLTFAMTTALVAGGAFAADKAVKSAFAAISSDGGVASVNATGSISLADIRTVTDAVSEPSNLLAAICTCHGWNNGNFTNAVDAVGVQSHFGGALTNAIQAADDVYLNECSIWKLQSISADFITNSLSNPATMKAVCEIYADCNGCPTGKPLYKLTDFTYVDAGTPYLANPAYRIVNYKFSISSSNTDPRNRAIVLHGGVYWISIYKLSDNIGCTMPLMKDQSFWGASSPGVKGSTPKFRSSTSGNACTNTTYRFNDTCGPTGWRDVSNCCFGCRDLNFELCADECPIYYDNGIAAGYAGGVAGGSPSQFAIDDKGNVLNSDANSRTADDFPVPACNTLELCYIEGCIFTNCVLCDRTGDIGCFVGSYEIYGNICLTKGNYPDYTWGGSNKTAGSQVGSSGSILCHGDATQAVDLGFAYSVTPIPGGGTISYEAYRLEFCTPNCTLPGGYQYWISIGARYNFSSLEAAFFCYNYDCTRLNCLIRWNDGKYLAPNAQVSPDTKTAWVPTGHDFSFLIAGVLRSSEPGGSGATATCAADFNKDGKPTVQDLFDFLSAWFAGCPH